jgi:hypothetical protein
MVTVREVFFFNQPGDESVNQQPALSVTEVGVLRSIAQQETTRAKEQRNARKAALGREMEATWAAEREIDKRLEPRIAELEQQVAALDAQKVEVCDRIQAVLVEMQQAKAPLAARRNELRREQLAINDVELGEQEAEKAR